jgi:predicted enzyme related to lactoylglutathione lyase
VGSAPEAWNDGAVTAAIGLVLDCSDPDRLAAFWAPALGYQDVGAAGSYRLLLPPAGEQGPQLLLQQVAEEKNAKLRMHLDIHTPDIEAEAARLADLGAERVQANAVAEHGSSWILMRDPEGNEFCVCDAAGGAC